MILIMYRSLFTIIIAIGLEVLMTCVIFFQIVLGRKFLSVFGESIIVVNIRHVFQLKID